MLAIECLKNGKPVDKIHWCYLNAKQLEQLQTTSVRQTFTQNVTQKVRQNENGDSGFLSGKNGSPGEIRTLVSGSRACADFKSAPEYGFFVDKRLEERRVGVS